MQHRRGLAQMVAAAILLAGCSAAVTAFPSQSSSPMTATPAPVTPTPSAMSTAQVSASPASNPPSPPAASATVGTLPHDAPDLEAVMPKTVAGRQLAIWSVTGRHVLEEGGQSAEQIAAVVEQVQAAGASIDGFAEVIAGRANVDADPPYFVFAYRLPAGTDAILLPYVLGAAGFTRSPGPSDFTKKTVGGKAVEVGTPPLIAQDIHERGSPYLYGHGDLLFIVVTDQPGWAADALRQLP